MRRSWIPVAAVAMALLAAAPAQAGTYEVVSCGAPGAGGVNHELQVRAEDAAGNLTVENRTVAIDGTPPNARIALAEGRGILVDVTDNVSGVASGQILVRGSTKEPFRALPTTLSGGRLRARMDRGRAGRSDIRVVADDVAGNRREVLGTKLRITSARSGRFRLCVPLGPGRVRFSGRVRSLGQPFPTRGVILALQGLENGRWNTFLDTRTNRRGRWSVSSGFSGRPGTYPIRVRIRRQALFPFVLGTSPAIRVRVR